MKGYEGAPSRDTVPFMKAFLTVVGVSAVTVASATTLNLTMLADDFFEAYISTNDSVQGTQFLVQSNTWQSGAVTGSVALTPNVVNYLHINARDVFGQPSMIIGEASLSDSGFAFPNSLTTLLTNTTDWKVSLSGYGSGYFTPTDLGPNGSGPWGFNSGISASARRIWSNQTTGEHYFSVALTPVPEPATIGLLIASASLYLKRRKRA